MGSIVFVPGSTVPPRLPPSRSAASPAAYPRPSPISIALLLSVWLSATEPFALCHPPPTPVHSRARSGSTSSPTAGGTMCATLRVKSGGAGRGGMRVNLGAWKRRAGAACGRSETGASVARRRRARGWAKGVDEMPGRHGVWRCMYLYSRSTCRH
ncbi:hypothetical protein B0H11DRAFT_2128085 [Mycena galericulata]|nr:hypothetical protein B0H11DRAFT_2128085 [Mycena galericulata]